MFGLSMCRALGLYGQVESQECAFKVSIRDVKGSLNSSKWLAWLAHYIVRIKARINMFCLAQCPRPSVTRDVRELRLE
jgi:hypothetical protein